MTLSRKIRTAFRLFRQKKEQVYVAKVSRNAPWVYVSYISDAFYQKGRLSFHQNRREALAMVGIFGGMGYNVYVQDLFSDRRLPSIHPEIVFGQGPCFEKALEKYPEAKAVYYATGAYYQHQNRQVKEMTDAINKRYGSSIPYRRLVEDVPSYEKADNILLIGSNYTIETFPEDLRSKITIIHQSAQSSGIGEGVAVSPQNEFFFMGSSGNMLRGVPLLVDFFSAHPDLTIHIVGPVDEEYYDVIKDTLPSNIFFYGFLEVGSEEMAEITSRCNFIIYPSGSEGGCPGSVINAMKLGLIPIVTRWAAFDGIEDYGYLIKSWDVKGIEDGVEWALSLPAEEIGQRKTRCQRFADETFSIERFKAEFKQFFNNKCKR